MGSSLCFVCLNQNAACTSNRKRDKNHGNSVVWGFSYEQTAMFKWVFPFPESNYFKPTWADSPLSCPLLHFKSVGLNINQSVLNGMRAQCFVCLFVFFFFTFLYSGSVHWDQGSQAHFQGCTDHDHVHTCTHSHLEAARCYTVDLLAIEQFHWRGWD